MASLENTPQQKPSPIIRYVLIGIIVALAAMIGYFSYRLYEARYGGEAYGVPFTLVDQNGAEITEAAFAGHPSMVFFGFTNCPEICPTTLADMDTWLKALGSEGKDIHAYFVTIDPEHDTAAVMKDYVTSVSDRIVGITGDPEKVLEMSKGYGIYSKKVPLDTGGYTMDHTASVLLLHGGRQFAGTIAYGETKEAAILKLKRLAADG
jgi:protein SCO1